MDIFLENITLFSLVFNFVHNIEFLNSYLRVNVMLRKLEISIA